VLPNVTLAQQLFDEFRLNYRMLESWHLRNRQKTLRAVLKEDMRQAFASVAGDAKVAPDRFVDHNVGQILAVDVENKLVHLDRDFAMNNSALWFVDDTPATVSRVDECVYEVTTSLPLMPGQDFCQHVQVTDTDDMLKRLQDFWEPRWNRLADVPPQHWDRLLDFVRAYVPPGQFVLPQITTSMWEQVNKRYASNAARGADGFGHLDLLRMPSCYQAGLVSLFNAVESGSPWPSQLCLGFCHPLPKRVDAQQVAEFRPIVVMSILYRSWSALRSRSLLGQLKPLVGPDVVGFMPAREAGEIWHYVQNLVELALQSKQALHGVVSDIRKAFESIPRKPLFAVMAWLGFPPSLLSAWDRLTCLERRFTLCKIMKYLVQTRVTPQLINAKVIDAIGVDDERKI
jgi:hypothetical protein